MGDASVEQQSPDADTSPEAACAELPADEGDNSAAEGSPAGPASPQAEDDAAQARVVPTPGFVQAAWEGALLEVRHLIGQRADPNHFESHQGGATRLTPLMAAAAGGKVDVVAELLVAGSDPDLPSAAGVVAGDLVDDNKAGKKIDKLLATFRVEIESRIAATVTASPLAPPGSDDAPAPSPPAPDAAAAAAAVAFTVRRAAIAKVQQRGLALVEKALLGYSSALTRNACLQDQDEDEDVALAGESALAGDAARQARKNRREEKETARLQRVADRAAARRGVDLEEDRARRVAEKAAARRGRDPAEEEDARLKRVAEKAAARRSKQAEQERLQKEKEEAKIKRLADKANDRASIKKLRSVVEDEVQKEHLAELRHVPVKRKVVEAEASLCTNCGTSGVRQRCGKCERNGMCAACSKCGLCGTITGFADKVARVCVPGMWST